MCEPIQFAKLRDYDPPLIFCIAVGVCMLTYTHACVLSLSQAKAQLVKALGGESAPGLQ